ncbi:hypothetical protein P692DRAFT_20873842 [Suillus brevipes Sb2]|nr:hypothetical protein P692DRAFT_20873842 [Suillus brevipes Sb2]
MEESARYPEWREAYDMGRPFPAITNDPSNHILFSNWSAAKADKTWSKGYTRKGAALHGARRYDEAVEHVQVSNYWYNCVQTFSYTYGSPYNSRFYSCLPNILNNQYRHLDLRGIRPPPSSPLSLALSPLSPPLSLTLSPALSPLLSSPLSPPSLCPAACLSSLCCRSIIRCSHKYRARTTLQYN